MRKSSENLSLLNGISINYKLEKMPLRKVERYALEREAKQREEAWRLVQNAIFTRKPAIDQLANQAIMHRNETARMAGFKSYREYIHQKKGRFSYSLEDLAQFRQAVQQFAVPIVTSVNKNKARQLGQSQLHPWDIHIDDACLAQRPYRDLEDLLDRATRVFECVNPGFAVIFSQMRSAGTLDLEVRPKKASVGFTLPTYRRSGAFISLNVDAAVPRFADCVGLHHPIHIIALAAFKR
jgi:oligoendopeptidase F